MSEATLDSFQRFGELLKHLRRRARLTLKELGIAVGYSEAHVARLESGQRLPDLGTVRTLLIPALGLDKEPAIAARLIELAEIAHGIRSAESPAPGAPPTSATSPAVIARPNTNLPRQLTRFVGREQEMAEVERLQGATRLLTLTGSGGAGKTRLAIEVGARLARAPVFYGGVWLVEFASLAEDRLVADSVAAALGLQTMSRTALEVLCDHLRDQNALLILDNCEHLLQGCAELAVALLRECPHLCLLVTSREPLNVPGEVTWRVPSLELDDATELFVERARAARPDFTLTPANTAAVTQICQRLDSMPLALELAAARLRAFSVEQIATRLDDAFRLLTGGSRVALPRQQTLQATIDWSYNLLTEPERALLYQLSVFAGGWMLEAAEAIHGDGTLELLEQLVNKSLVVAEQRTGDETAGMRYHLLETIRQYAAARLVSTGEREQYQARQRHLEYFVSFQKAVRSHENGPEHRLLLGRLKAENDNMRAALNWAVQCGDWRAGIPLIECLFILWNAPGYTDEISKQMDALVLSNPSASESAHLDCLIISGFMQVRRGNIDGSLDWYRQASILAHRIEDVDSILEANVKIGLATPDEAEAAAVLNRVIQLARRVGRLDYEADALETTGDRLWSLGNHVQALEVFVKGLALAREHHMDGPTAEILFRIGQVYLDLQDYAQARKALEEANEHYLKARYEERQETLVDLGTVGLYTGDYAPARKALSICFHINLIHDNLERLAQGLVLAAGLAHMLGKLDQSAQLLGAAAAIRRDHHTHGIFEHELFAEYERRLPAVRAALDPVEFDRAWAEGQKLTLKEAIATALAV